jgi:hypothetical protein
MVRDSGDAVIQVPAAELILLRCLRFQACSQTVCEPPQTVTCALPLTLQPFLISERDRELLKRKASKS